MTGRLIGGPRSLAFTAGALLLGAGCATGLQLHMPLRVAGCTVALFAPAVVVRTRPRARVVATLLLCCALGLLRGALAVHVPSATTLDGHAGAGPVAVAGTVRDVTRAGQGAVLLIDATRLSLPDGDFAVGGGAYAFLARAPSVDAGDAVTLDAARLELPSHAPGPHSSDRLEREDIQVIAVSPSVFVNSHAGSSPGRLLATIRASLVSGVQATLPPSLAALVLGVSLGVHVPIAPAAAAPLRETGLYHVVALSGLKVAIVIGMVSRLGLALRWRPALRAGVALVSVGGYALLGGGGAAAARSGLMAGAAMPLRLGGREPAPIPLLAACAALMLAVKPALAVDAGFQLSFLGTAGILVAAGPLARRIPGPRVVAEAIAVTAAAQVATVPVMASTFGVVTPVGPLTNAAVLPLLPVMIVAGLAGALLAALSAPGAGLVLGLAGLGARWIEAVAGAATRFPGHAVHIAQWPVAWTLAEALGVAVASGVAVMAHRGTGRARTAPVTAGAGRGHISRPVAAQVAVALAAILPMAGGLAALARHSDGRLDVSVLDVGGGTAVLIRTGGGELALVDGGADGRRLQDAFAARVSALGEPVGLLVLTGGDHADMGAIDDFATRVHVAATVAPAGELGPAASATIDTLAGAGAQIERVAAGTAWTWGGATWSLLPAPSSSGNTAQSVLRVAENGAAVLVLGSLPVVAQAEVAGVGVGLRSDLVVAPPQGDVDLALLRASGAAEVAVPDRHGRRGGPSPSGVTVRRTGSDGTLDYTATDAGLRAT